MIALGNIKIVLKIGLIVAALGLQMIGQTWFAASRMNNIDESYSDVIGRLNKYAMLAVRAARSAEIYLLNSFQLAAASTEQESAQWLAQVNENRRAYETQMADVCAERVIG